MTTAQLRLVDDPPDRLRRLADIIERNVLQPALDRNLPGVARIAKQEIERLRAQAEWTSA